MRAPGICVWLGLAASLAAQTGGQEPEGLLTRIKAHVGESLKRLPSYTCLETVERFERRGASTPFVLVEPNRVAGRANAWLAKAARRVYTQYPEVDGIPADKVCVSGMPHHREALPAALPAGELRDNLAAKRTEVVELPADRAGQVQRLRYAMLTAL